jgi:hypothetical protein
MADSSFAEFDLLSGLNAGDYLVGYRNIRETRVEISDLINNTLAVGLSTMSDLTKSNSVYSSVNSNSANWNSNYAYVNANSPSWNSVYTTVNSNSSLVSLSAVQSQNILVLGNNVTVLSAVELGTVTLASPVSAFVVQINGVNYRLLAYQ